jgi:hypothetical protein
MKFNSSRLGIMVVILMMAGTSIWAQGRGARGRGTNNPETCPFGIANLPLEDLSSEESANLTLMREEEKLARDVYRTMYMEHGLRIFANIAGSEQRHMDAVKSLIDRYGLPDPVETDEVGVFTDPRLQSLYHDLVASGRESLAAALHVGAAIEDLDIYDLETALAANDNADIAMVFGNLLAGSRNHLRAFVGQLERMGESFEPEYLDPGAVEEILSSPWERGGGGFGMGRGSGGGRNGSRGMRTNRPPQRTNRPPQ